jgi:formate hydrogenlyase subunit 3/multisubunit Na+/H+ antiporter MnhD subunit
MSALLALLVPLTLASLLLAVPRSAVFVVWLAPAAAVPLLLAPWLTGEVPLDWLGLGLRLGVSPGAWPLLLLAGLLWSAAGISARQQHGIDRAGRRYWVFHLLTLAGNAGVFVAQDLAGLYTCYALMTFAAYGLVVHDLQPASLYAGRVYLVMAVLAEIMLVSALLLLGAEVGNASLPDAAAALAWHSHGTLVVVLLFCAFAVKMGTIPLHMWLPLAHPQAPIPASAVLSGVIVKAGLAGWLALLPPGGEGVAAWSTPVILLGLVSTFLAVLLGIAQRRAKAVLAYSTISQMGLVTVLVGVGMSSGQAWTAMLPVAMLFALHHGLAKGALFLGLAVHWRHRGWGLLLAALLLAGLPPGGGAFAKAGAKLFVEAAAPAGWSGLPLLLALSSLATALLLARFLWLAWRPADPLPLRATPAAAGGWLLALAAALLLPPLAIWLELPEAIGYAVQPGALFDSLWPLALAALLLLAVTAWGRRRPLPIVPEGDLVVPLTRALRWFVLQPRPSLPAVGVRSRHLYSRFARLLVGLERRQLDVTWGGLMLLTLALLLAMTMLLRP